ncbi:MAG: hypothetical protein MUC83_08105 [Pirellula sp.]|nr:hypothetical protein [Pirellula sp.]
MSEQSTSLATMHSPYVYALGWSQFTELFRSSRSSSESRILGIESVSEETDYAIQGNIEDLLLRKAMSNRLGIKLDDDELGDIATDVNARVTDICMASQSWEVSDVVGDATAEADYTLELSLLESVGDIARDLARAKESQQSPSHKSEAAKP